MPSRLTACRSGTHYLGSGEGERIPSCTLKISSTDGTSRASGSSTRSWKSVSSDREGPRERRHASFLIPRRPLASGPASFPTTRWSRILAARDGDPAMRRPAALAELCRAYWYPLYAFIRRRGHDPESPRDLTQEFFARLIEADFLAGVDRPGEVPLVPAGRLHPFPGQPARLRAGREAGRRPSVVSIDAAEAEGRYGLEPSHRLTPEALFARRWALTVLSQALDRLRAEHQAAGLRPARAVRGPAPDPDRRRRPRPARRAGRPARPDRRRRAGRRPPPPPPISRGPPRADRRDRGRPRRDRRRDPRPVRALASENRWVAPTLRLPVSFCRGCFS